MSRTTASPLENHQTMNLLTIHTYIALNHLPWFEHGSRSDACQQPGRHRLRRRVISLREPKKITTLFFFFFSPIRATHSVLFEEHFCDYARTSMFGPLRVAFSGHCSLFMERDRERGSHLLDCPYTFLCLGRSAPSKCGCGPVVSYVWWKASGLLTTQLYIVHAVQ